MRMIGLVLMLGLGTGSLVAQAPDPCATAPQTCATVINTQATARRRVPNTVADITVAVTVSDKDLASTQRALTERSNQVLAYLRGQKVERLMTADVSFQPEVKPQKNALDKTVGYTGSSRVSFRVAAAKAPEVLAGVIPAGANNIDGTTFTPTEEEMDAARRELAAEATKIAVSQAGAIAEAAGMHVAALRNVNVQGDAVPVYARAKVMMMAAPAASPMAMDTEAGDQTLTMRVDVTAAAVK